MTQDVTEDTVRMAYRLLLDRDPDSDLVAKSLSTHVKSVSDLRDYIVSSQEYKGRNFLHQLNQAYWHERPQVDVDVSHSIFETLVERLRKQWKELGGMDPYWSVLSDDQYRLETMTEEALSQFYDTGRQSAELLDIFARRTGVTLPTGTCLELGCGVGRVTRRLADRFERVIAVDISAGNLAICDEYLAREGVTNVETRLISAPDDLNHIGPIDVFYSIIVLQHNPPPIQKLLLQLILGQLVSGGVFLFQTPDTITDYSFQAKDVEHMADAAFDMHCLPKVVILKMLSELGLEVRDVIIDWATGAFGSYTYFGRRA